VDIHEFELFVQNCFKQKRKTLLNNLNSAYGWEKIEVENFLTMNNLTNKTRSEEISNVEFKDLFNKFKEYQK